MLTLRAGSFGSLRNSPSPVASHRQVLLQECAVVAVLLRRILWRRAARRNQTLHRAAGDTALVAAYPGLKSRACATHWGVIRPRFRRKLRIVAVVPGFIAAKRAAELHFAETKTVAEAVRGPGEFFQFRTALGVQQIELFTAVSEAAEADSEQSDFSFHVPMGAKEFLKHRKNVGIESRGLPQCFGASVRFEAGVPNGQCERSRGETGFAQTLAGFLR